jgi:hypothetical protein
MRPVRPVRRVRHVRPVVGTYYGKSPTLPVLTGHRAHRAQSYLWAPMAGRPYRLFPRARARGAQTARARQRSYYPLFCTVAQTAQVLEL